MSIPATRISGTSGATASHPSEKNVAGLAVIGPRATLVPLRRFPPPEGPRAYSHPLPAPRSLLRLAGRVPQRSAPRLAPPPAPPTCHQRDAAGGARRGGLRSWARSEEDTAEIQSRLQLLFRLFL